MTFIFILKVKGVEGTHSWASAKQPGGVGGDDKLGVHRTLSPRPHPGCGAAAPQGPASEKRLWLN